MRALIFVVLALATGCRHGPAAEPPGTGPEVTFRFVKVPLWCGGASPPPEYRRAQPHPGRYQVVSLGEGDEAISFRTDDRGVGRVRLPPGRYCFQTRGTHCAEVTVGPATRELTVELMGRERCPEGSDLKP